jgi:magnesium transporter
LVSACDGAGCRLLVRHTDAGAVIALAMAFTLVAAALGGIVIPIALERLNIDPALASGPFVTTVTDVVGFFAFLGLASLILM